jgi:hypothetical protein
MHTFFDRGVDRANGGNGRVGGSHGNPRGF